MVLTALLALALMQSSPPAQAPPQDEPIHLPAIVYPAGAKAARIQGTVHIEVHVDPTGKVTEVNVLDGPVQLRQAATDAYTQATYKPLIKNGFPAPAIITTAVNFTLSEAPPTTDMQVNAKFQPLHLRCQQLSSEHSPDALGACREAVEMAQRFSATAELEARATAYNDLVLLLIVDGKKSTNLPEAGLIADQAVNLVTNTPGDAAHKPAVAVAYITRAEVRSLANDLNGATADCTVAEETLNTLLADQAKKMPTKLDETENERAGNYRVQLRGTLLLHAIVLDRQHKTKQAKLLREQADHI